LAPRVKEAQNGGEKKDDVYFITGTMNLCFDVTGQIGMKFRKKTSIGVLY